MSSKHLILLGTHDFDIFSVIFDSSANTLELVDTTRVKEHPSWLTQHPYVPLLSDLFGHG